MDIYLLLQKSIANNTELKIMIIKDIRQNLLFWNFSLLLGPLLRVSIVIQSFCFYLLLITSHNFDTFDTDAEEKKMEQTSLSTKTIIST